jgi:dTDP-glucose pyrophosphorylase
MKKIQLLIPMAGLGTRFSLEGYEISKPLLPIGRYKMIEVVLKNLLSKEVGSVTLVANSKVAADSNLESLLSTSSYGLEIITVDQTTEGPASTCYLTRNSIDYEAPLVIANSDQFLDTDMSQEYSQWLNSTVDGIIWAMEDTSPKWSYVKVDSNGFALEIKEKLVISNLATCGVYGFTRAGDFFESYESMLKVGDRTNGEFYVAPTYNYLISQNKRILVKNLGLTSKVMHGLGVPSDYETFLSSEIFKRFQ